MTISIKHQFVSLKGDGTDATQVQPSYWNAAHSFTMATAKLVGRVTAGVGAAEEIDLSPYMAGLLGTADAATLAGILGLFETGDLKYTYRTAASPGWVLMLGGSGTPPNTIGNAASSATLRANADTFELYKIIYAGCSDAIAPVSGGRTGNSTNDFNSGKTIQIPNPVGRSPIGAGAATAVTATRVLGTPYGVDTQAIVLANLPPYTPVGTLALNAGTLAGIYNGGTPIVSGAGAGVGGGGSFGVNGGTGVTITGSPAGTFNGTPQGGTSTPMNILHSSIALNVMVKL